MKVRRTRHPSWLKVPLPAGDNFNEVRKLLRDNNLHTVCQSAHCPIIGECWGHRTSTFMILGDICTRNCRYCAVVPGHPEPLDLDEPKRVAKAVKTLNLRYAVITSVTRDDVPDGGASIFADTIHEIRKVMPDCHVEVLIPDFLGSRDSLNIVLEAKPEVLNHNLETVPQLYDRARPQANYRRSLKILEWAKQAGNITKSGLMLGLGETEDDVIHVMKDLREIECDILTLGQYLQPSASHLPIDRYVTPDEFMMYRREGKKLGFQHVEAGPLVRSSYHAAMCYDEMTTRK